MGRTAKFGDRPSKCWNWPETLAVAVRKSCGSELLSSTSRTKPTARSWNVAVFS
eukprot:CAMPEP_0175307208 /NCGR_PEP_ID=MMETSP0093-20121207/64649_1 /TAXON_ID=311494 /ORGANISM="Alexandrium monilatum, Strain CCMP3105" /LENGTH=53 /DNA_ID=CAMNT_0016603675 /DNA_START=126 /DNA_END=284 /DNA_ORIENTATION=+